MNKRFLRDIVYDLAVPPFGMDYYHMSSKKAEQNFNWFQSVIPERIQYLKTCYARDTGDNIEKLDYSSDSLIGLWKWFCSIARMEKTPENELKSMVEGAKVFGESYINYEQFTVATKYIMRDIGMYLGQCFILKYNDLYWTYYTKPKNSIDVNQPIIAGFWVTGQFEGAAHFNPVSAVEGCAANFYYKNQKSTDLFEIYIKWERYVPSKNSE